MRDRLCHAALAFLAVSLQHIHPYTCRPSPAAHAQSAGVAADLPPSGVPCSCIRSTSPLALRWRKADIRCTNARRQHMRFLCLLLSGLCRGGGCSMPAASTFYTLRQTRTGAQLRVARLGVGHASLPCWRAGIPFLSSFYPHLCVAAPQLPCGAFGAALFADDEATRALRCSSGAAACALVR